MTLFFSPTPAQTTIVSLWGGNKLPQWLSISVSGLLPLCLPHILSRVVLLKYECSSVILLYKMLQGLSIICGIKSEVHPWLMGPYVIWCLLSSLTYFSLLCSNHPQLPEGSPQAKHASKTRSCTFSAWELFLLCCPHGLLTLSFHLGFC